MPIFDYICPKCGQDKDDEYVRNADEDIFCHICKTKMDKKPSNFSFNFSPPGITKFKRKYGKTVPPEYKTTGGANIYGVPRKSK